MTRFEFVRSWISRPVTLGRSLVAVTFAVTAASLLRWLLGTAADPVPFVTYFPAVVLCTLYAGARAGVASILASMAVVNFMFRAPRMRASFDPQTAMMMALFLASCLLLVVVANALRRTMAELQAAKQRTEFLNQELLHRVRNTLTVINALAVQTYRVQPDRFREVFTRRMSALAGGLDLLSRENVLQCDARELVEKACEPFQQADNIAIEGSSCTLHGDSAVPLTLAIHELCTNAVKYGALSADTGRVRIVFDKSDDDGTLVIEWSETGGPPVKVPTRKGLGSVLLRDAKLGPAKVEFLPEGLQCRMRLREYGDR